ncbi:LytR/AlgR family response regulator transcription factor [Gottschalkia acidurici]|uniref:LytR/AlgR family response regulator transcription factor n=1 Tax=Clostridium acidurici TaxID=1556 RepID=UPI001E597442|nr:response regulator [Gottschalkia acidurici]
MLLDILMDNLTGIDVVRKIRKFDDKVEIIFTTSILDYAQQRYEVRACRYLIKPINCKELKKYIVSFIDEIRKNNESYTFIQERNEIHKVLIEDITYVEIIRKDMTIHAIEKI